MRSVEDMAHEYAVEILKTVHANHGHLSEIDELKAQLECCRRENAVLLGKVGELEKNEFLLARVKTILGCEKKTNLLESIIVRDLRKVLRGEHE